MEVEKKETPFSLFYRLQSVFFNAEQLNFLKTRKRQTSTMDDMDDVLKMKAQSNEKTEKQTAKIQNNENWITSPNKNPIQSYRKNIKNNNITRETRYIHSTAKQYMNMERYYTQKQPMQSIDKQEGLQRQNTMKQISWVKKAEPQEHWNNQIVKQKTTNPNYNLIQKHEKMNERKLFFLQYENIKPTIINENRRDNAQRMQQIPRAIQLTGLKNEQYTNINLINEGRKEKIGFMNAYIFDKNEKMKEGNKQINGTLRPKIQNMAYLKKRSEINERQINNTNSKKMSEVQKKSFSLHSSNNKDVPAFKRAMVLEGDYLDNININKKKLFDPDNQSKEGTTTIRMQNDFHIQGNEFSSKTEANPFELAEKIGRQIANEIESSVSGWYR